MTLDAPKPELGATLRALSETIEMRRHAAPETSFTARLLAGGPARCAKKLGEEGVDTALAVAASDRPALVAESADLLYHLLVSWAVVGVLPEDVAAELVTRQGLSGVRAHEGEKRSVS